MQQRTTFYDKSEDKYNLLSALQKSVRGSDPDAAVHYLARLIQGGADEKMIGRRLLVMASEDIGMLEYTFDRISVFAFKLVDVIEPVTHILNFSLGIGYFVFGVSQAS